MRALYNFAYGLSHEINNPLANIATRGQTLLMDEQDPERRRKLATIVQQAFRAHEMIADLMLFARPPALELKRVDLAELAETIVGELQSRAAAQKTELVRRGSKRLSAMVDPVQIAVALKALVQNSLDALSAGGRIEVTAEYEVRNQAHRAKSNGQLLRRAAKRQAGASAIKNDRICLRVWDDGPGIPLEMMPQIFDPFFCGREAGRGLGLGLSKVWRIVESHGGQIEAVSLVGCTQFEIFLNSSPAALVSRR
jgi:signal transduction histidine kinase